jgi:glutaminase
MNHSVSKELLKSLVIEAEKNQEGNTANYIPELANVNPNITAIAVSSNGRLFAQAIDNGTILIYDTEYFQLMRIYEGDKS